MWFAIGLVVAFTAAFLLLPSAKMQDAKAAGFDEFTYPTNSNSRVIPEIFGTVEAHGNIIYAGQLSSNPITQKAGKGKKQTVGHSYYMGLSFALCTGFDEFISFKMNGDVVATPRLSSNGSFFARTAKGDSTANQKSQIYIYTGKNNTPNEALSRWCGKALSYSGIGYFVFYGFVGENTTSTPNYSAIIRRTNLLDWGYIENIQGDANPAAILYYLLSVLVEYQPSSIDLASFKNVAVTLYNEGLGMSFSMSNPNEASEWIEEILRTIDGVLVIKDGLLSLKLLRGDYDKTAIKKVNSKVASKIKLNKKGWDELYTKITVKYTDRNTFKSASLCATNTAAKLALGYDRAYDVEYMGISSSVNAKKILDRLFKKVSYPLSSLSFKIAQSEFSNMNIGDVFGFESSELGVKDMIFRITSIGSDRQDDQSMSIEATTDIFGLSAGAITIEQEDLSQRLNLDIGEIEYFECRDAMAEQSTQRAIIPLVAKPSGFVQNISAKEGDMPDKADASAFLLATLEGSYGITNDIDENGFLVRAISPLYPMEATDLAWQRVKFSGFIGNEQFAYGKIETTNNPNVFRIKRIIRGLNNTKKSSYYGGTKVWLCEDTGREVGILPITSPTPTIKVQASNYLNLTEVKSLNYTYGYSVEKPYPPANIIAKRNGDVINISWGACVRLGGANFRNCDTIVAGEDEAKSEGFWEVVSFPSASVIQTDKPSCEIRGANMLGIRSVLGGYTSDWVYMRL